MITTIARVAIVGFCLVAVWAEHAASQPQEINAPLLQVCNVVEPSDLSWDYRWRWRAEQNLSCLIGALERGIDKAKSNRQEQVTIPVHEAEQLLKLAWWARDSSQRIGR